MTTPIDSYFAWDLADRIHRLPLTSRAYPAIEQALLAICSTSEAMERLPEWKEPGRAMTRRLIEEECSEGREELLELEALVNDDEELSSLGVTPEQAPELRSLFRHCILEEMERLKSSEVRLHWVQAKEERRQERQRNLDALERAAPSPSVEAYFHEFEEDLQQIGLSAREIDQALSYDQLALKEAIQANWGDFLFAISFKQFTLAEVAQMPAENFKFLITNHINIRALLDTGLAIAALTPYLDSEQGRSLLLHNTTASFVTAGLSLADLSQREEAERSYGAYLNFLTSREN